MAKSNTVTNIEVITLNETLTEARNAVASAITSTYGALGRYASLLNSLHSNDWFEVKHFDKSAEAQPINNEKKAFYIALREAKHTNPSVIWARVCAFGKAEKYGAIDSEESTEGNEGNEEQAEGVKIEKAEPRSPMLRNIEELVALWKFNNKNDALPKALCEVQDLITQALKVLNVNIANLD
jgi:hypothetical protein